MRTYRNLLIIQLLTGTTQVSTAGFDKILRPPDVPVYVIDTRIRVLDLCRDGFKFLYGFFIIKSFHFSCYRFLVSLRSLGMTLETLQSFGMTLETLQSRVPSANITDTLSPFERPTTPFMTFPSPSRAKA